MPGFVPEDALLADFFEASGTGVKEDGESVYGTFRRNDLLQLIRAARDAAAPIPTASAPKAEGECDGKTASTCRNQTDCEIAGRCLEADRTREGGAVKVPGLGRMFDDDDGFLTLQFVDEESAQRFIAAYYPSVEVDDMPPMRSAPPEQAAREPLTEDELKTIDFQSYRDAPSNSSKWQLKVAFARALERAHNILPSTQEPNHD